MSNKKDLTDKALELVNGGLNMTNPASGLSEEEAKKIAEALGQGKDMGSWETMSGEQFMKWWESSNKKAGNEAQ